jgi:hypothetical protein
MNKGTLSIVTFEKENAIMNGEDIMGSSLLDINVIYEKILSFISNLKKVWFKIRV